MATLNAPRVLRCNVTGNPAGTDTLIPGMPCKCPVCWAVGEIQTLVAALELITDQYEQICADHNVAGWPAAVAATRAAIARATGSAS